jgi:hypothetical protein
MGHPADSLYSSGWDQQALAAQFQTLQLQQPPQHEWYFDTSATNHVSSDAGTLSSTAPSSISSPSIIVGDDTRVPVTSTGSTQLPHNLHLNNVLVAPNLIKNLIFVRQFTIDNNCSVEFDPFGCSGKDPPTRSEIIRCNSTGSLYPLLPLASALLAASSSSLWHQRLGHPGHEALSKLAHSAAIKCAPGAPDGLCHACQLGRHVRLPFPTSSSRTSHVFQLLHCDLWTSPITSVSGYKYYLVILDDYSHYLWTFPMRLKSDTFSTLSNFFAYVHTQFGVPIQGLQSDNGHEFDNLNARSFFASPDTSYSMKRHIR